jgi:MFS family permease
MRGPDFHVLRHRDFALYISSSFLWTIGLQVQALALAWQIYEITRDPFQLGLIGLLEFLPAALLALPAGHLADRLDRRRLILVGVAAEFSAALVLVGFALSGRMSVPVILSLALVFGIARAISTPPARALLPNLMPKDELASAIAWSSTSWQVATIAGPGLGGLLYAVAPPVAYGGAALAFAAAVIATFLMRGRPVEPSPPATVDGGGDLAAIVAGLVLICRHKLLLAAVSLDLFAVLFSGATALIPVFAQDILKVGSDAGGLLRSAQGFGAVATALVLTQFPLTRHVGRRLFVAVGVFGLAALVFGLSHWYWLSFAAVLVLGAADMVSVYVRETLLQLWTPDDVRGRVNAVNNVFIGASNELGEFRAGTMAALIGVVPAVVVGGIGTLVVAGLWAWLFPDIRRVRHLRSRDQG